MIVAELSVHQHQSSYKRQILPFLQAPLGMCAGPQAGSKKTVLAERYPSKMGEFVVRAKTGRKKIKPPPFSIAGVNPFGV